VTARRSSATTAATVKCGTSVEIDKFIDDDLCGRRWAPYTAGQRAVMFLQRTRKAASNTGPGWSVLGSANEGELPVVGPNVILSRELVDNAQTVDIGGAKVVGKSVALPVVLKAIKEGKTVPGVIPGRSGRSGTRKR
jgi:hypothetical protein